ncbi:YiiX/YebB-like N1pC/P60 family cysteine hydrolase [Priestia megaterium]|uniref:YiiX/YebB-like N1pC/P60 family cysteine hydrolase n=1 Tax=Priestia megaterium TaxID=1404 RepID=UPI000BFC5C0A|nr:hypothetical protein CN981_09315 [Priestia megaterium]
MVGSVLYFKKTTSIISRLIAKLTSSEFTHVGLIVAYDDLTRVATIIESNRFVETRLSMIQLDDSHVVYTTKMTEDVRNRVVEFAYESLGAKYDYFQIFGLFLSLLFKKERHALFNSSNKMICSELIDRSYYRAGVPRKNSINIGNVTPQELIELYSLKSVRKGF